ncbi:Zn-dependent exopeptidase [Cucurbitaria berberidis CBS 394.84]|uniref:Peptide hydrolase n=1 Tax=Cucurbitaria berberidis CBS 394.84 TaxID=1168544 RepID=A0A9P4GP22_9PLEO|nr:Zn-dependent exopeptidase [Cucurbitaria berberidis CBS 394.84]KAF1850018.1 Zn-dependent exopeptidase [Cucurbitaria berberidis CBS 394.84]
MRYSFSLATFVAIATALPTLDAQRRAKLFTVELAPGQTKAVTEAGKLALTSQGIGFIDVTDWPQSSRVLANYTYPTELTQGESVQDLIDQLSGTNIRTNLEIFSSFNNRYYQSETGNQSAEWLLAQARSYIPSRSPVTVSIFPHVYRQSSIIATIPGKSAKTIVVGAHQDSINGAAGVNRTTARAPGADDDGSGSMTILEAFRTVLTNSTIANGDASHTIEFHFYAAEEVGLLGSGNIFRSYAEQKRDIAAMLNQDMTGYTAGYKSRNMTPKFGLVTDNTNALLNNFTRRVIKAYTKTEVADTECGYACSDHTSATRAGYPSAFVFEGEMHGPNDNPYVHTANDTIETIDFEHTVEHAKVVVGFVVELAFADL